VVINKGEYAPMFLQYICIYMYIFVYIYVYGYISGLTEEQLVVINKGEYAPVFLQPYAETKAMGEKAVRDACGSEVIMYICTYIYRHMYI
jgi:nucleoside-diphosphate-sugar epimerase